MISSAKTDQALYALNGILVTLRFWAYQNEDTEKIAKVLDAVEQLPRFLCSKQDQTEEFEKVLRGLAEEFPQLNLALERYLQAHAPENW